jgi:mono/diheme cytochrome c family protein
MRKLIPLIFLILILAACGAKPAEPANSPMTGMGLMSGMGARHHAAIPEDYAGKASPEVTDAMLATGSDIYTQQCASCHGDRGQGDGPAGTALDPAPAPVGHTSQMMSDAYLYWRVFEGGTPFGTLMPAWGEVLSDEEIWSVIGYIRLLGSGETAEFQAARHAEMLATAIERGLISQAEADTFTLVHDALDEYRTAHLSELLPGSADENQAYMLEELVGEATISQSQADDFTRIHQLLLDEGLMQ